VGLQTDTPPGTEGNSVLRGAPAELVVFVLSIAANILAISKILSERVSRGHDSVIRVGEKEVLLKGKWNPEEIANVISVISKQTSKEEALKYIAKIKSAKIEEAKRELAEIKSNIRQYKKLVQIFYELPKKEKHHKKKLKEYQNKLDEFQKRKEYLKSFIDFLNQEI